MERGKKRVVIVANTCWNLVNYRWNLIRRLSIAGYEVHVLAPQDKYLPKLQTLEINYHEFNLSAYGVNPLVETKSLVSLFILMKRVEPDLVLTFTIKPNIYGGIVTRLLKVPFMPNVTGLGSAFLKSDNLSRAWRILYQFSLNAAYKVFFQNPDDMSLFVSSNIVSPEQARLLPGSGIDTTEINVAPFVERRDRKFLFIGRLLKEKGIFEFLKAAASINKKYKDIKFLVAGHLPSESLERARVLIALQESSAVHYLGPVDDPYQQIADADVICLPSYREGTPRVVLEAAAIGRPVIASDVPGCSWAILDNITGFLCVPRSPDSLASAMQHAARMPIDDLKALGMAGRKHVEDHFAEETVINEYLLHAKALEL